MWGPGKAEHSAYYAQSACTSVTWVSRIPDMSWERRAGELKQWAVTGVSGNRSISTWRRVISLGPSFSPILQVH